MAISSYYGYNIIGSLDVAIDWLAFLLSNPTRHPFVFFFVFVFLCGEESEIDSFGKAIIPYEADDSDDSHSRIQSTIAALNDTHANEL